MKLELTRVFSGLAKLLEADKRYENMLGQWSATVRCIQRLDEGGGLLKWAGYTHSTYLS